MKPVFFAFGVLFFSAACSNAQSGDDPAALFARLDVNEDGWLSGNELENGRWTAFDRNGNSEVTREEFLAGLTTGEKNTPAPAEQSSTPVAETMPSGVYETYFFGFNYTLEKWLGGDIEIHPGGRYVFQDEAGRYTLDGETDRVIWQDGPLEGTYARYQLDGDGKPAIVLPREENEAADRELAVSDIWAYLRQEDWVP